jgi:hypothetical protein
MEKVTPAQPAAASFAVSAKSRGATVRQATRVRHAAHQSPHPGHAGRVASKHAEQAKKNPRSLRVASLKKR